MAEIELGRTSRALRLEFVDRRMTSKPGSGIATERGVLVKADGTEVTSGGHKIFLLCRPADRQSGFGAGAVAGRP